MADVNVFVFTGRLTADAQYRTLASGKNLLSANVAVNTGIGEYKKTTFVKVQWWGDKGKNIQSYLTKGTLIGTSGVLSTSEWDTKEGVHKTDIVVDVMNIQLLGSKITSQNKDDTQETSHDYVNENGEIAF